MLSANEVASVILTRTGEWMSSMTLQKLLYYAQAWHMAVTDEPLFAEAIEAWKDGPVVREVWAAHKEPASRRARVQRIDGIELDDIASGLIDLVIAHYGTLSGDELSHLTHGEEPWKRARRGIRAGEQSRKQVSLQLMAQYYRTQLLAGHTAADLAAGGIPVMWHGSGGPIDVDAILAELDSTDLAAADDPWGGGNLADLRGYPPLPARKHASAHADC